LFTTQYTRQTLPGNKSMNKTPSSAQIVSKCYAYCGIPLDIITTNNWQISAMHFPLFITHVNYYTSVSGQVSSHQIRTRPIRMLHICISDTNLNDLQNGSKSSAKDLCWELTSVQICLRIQIIFDKKELEISDTFLTELV